MTDCTPEKLHVHTLRITGDGGERLGNHPLERDWAPDPDYNFFRTQILAGISDGFRNWVPATNVRHRLNSRLPDSAEPCPAPATEGIWIMHQQMESLSAHLSLSFCLSKQTHFKKLSIPTRAPFLDVHCLWVVEKWAWVSMAVLTTKH